MPRLAWTNRPGRDGGLGAMGSPAGVGAAEAATTHVGTRGQIDVESHRQ